MASVRYGLGPGDTVEGEDVMRKLVLLVGALLAAAITVAALSACGGGGDKVALVAYSTPR